MSAYGVELVSVERLEHRSGRLWKRVNWRDDLSSLQSANTFPGDDVNRILENDLKVGDNVNLITNGRNQIIHAELTASGFEDRIVQSCTYGGSGYGYAILEPTGDEPAYFGPVVGVVWLVNEELEPLVELGRFLTHWGLDTFVSDLGRKLLIGHGPQILSSAKAGN